MRDKIAYLGIAALSVAIVAGLEGYGATRTARGQTEAATPIALMEFPDGTATPSELCGSCHQAIYRGPRKIDLTANRDQQRRERQ
jgi:hypothetical protein